MTVNKLPSVKKMLPYLTVFFSIASIYLPVTLVHATTYSNTYDSEGNLTSSSVTTGSTYVGTDDDGNHVHMDYGCAGDCDPNDPNINFRVGSSDNGDGGSSYPAFPPPKVSIQAKIKPHDTWYPEQLHTDGSLEFGSVDLDNLGDGQSDQDGLTLYIKPDDELRIRWSSTNANSCNLNFEDVEPYLEAEVEEEETDDQPGWFSGEDFEAYIEEYKDRLEDGEAVDTDEVLEGFGDGLIGEAPDDRTSGTYDVIPGLDPSYSIDYRVTCSGAGGSDSASLTVTVPGFVAVDFGPASKIIRSGDNTVISWKLELTDSLTVTDENDLIPYSYPCVIFGATPSTEPYTFDAADNNGVGQFTTRPLFNKFINKLYCGDIEYGDSTVEVIPAVREI